jgi:hypothetical protein
VSQREKSKIAAYADAYKRPLACQICKSQCTIHQGDCHGRMARVGHGLPKVSTGPAMLTLLCPADGPPPKEPYGRFWGGHLFPFSTPHAVQLWHPHIGSSFVLCIVQSSRRKSIGVRHGVSKRVKEGQKPLALWAGHPQNGHKAISEWSTHRA